MLSKRVRLTASLLVWDSLAIAAGAVAWRSQHGDPHAFMLLLSMMIFLSFYLVAVAVARGGQQMLILLPLLPFAWMVAPVFLAWFAIRDTWCCVRAWRKSGSKPQVGEGVWS
jgi:hypothetical protein